MILLPASPGPVSIDWQQLDFGGVNSPALGATDQRINRLGNRFMAAVTMPPMVPAVAGAWVAALNRGLRDGVRWALRQVELTIPAVVASVYGAGQVGQALVIRTDAINYAAALVPGQAITLVSAATGRRYVHLIYSAAQPSGDVISLQIDPPMRYPPAHDDVVLIAAPTIEGLLQGDGVPWSISRARRVGLAFTIRERA